jgi:hypothetical protein
MTLSRSFIFIFLLALVTGLGFMTEESRAQGVQLDPVRVRIVPEVPGPNSPVRIELQDATATLQDAVITWRLNGSVALSGSARRTFTFSTGGLGETSRVTVTIETSSGVVIDREFVFRPSAVHLAWEARTYVPPFYKGKALLSPGADVRVFAFTDIRDAAGNRIPESNLVFNWERNDTKFADRSGLGVSSFSFGSSQLASGEDILVNVLTKDGTRVGQASIFIPASDPLIRLYQRSPLRGILYERALFGVIDLVEEEVAIVAEPYFFSGNTRSNETFQYEWRLDGNPVAQDNTSAILTLRNQQAGEGEALLSVSVQNTVVTRLLQAAETRIGFMFGREDASSF